MSETVESILYENLGIDNELELRQVELDEAELIFNLVDKNREHLGRWLPWVKQVQSPDDSLAFIASSLRGRQESTHYGYGMIFRDELVGYVSLLHAHKDVDPKIGYWISSDQTGRGITTRAVNALTQFGLTTLALEKIIIRAHPDNIASNTVAIKAGYITAGYQDVQGDTFNIWSTPPNETPLYIERDLPG